MKMRFWQKTYLFTLALLLICLNMGILSLAVYTHRKNVEAAETAVKAEQYYVAMSFERDYDVLTASDTNAGSLLLMQSYGAYYGNRGVLLCFAEDGKILYSELASDFEMPTNTLRHVNLEGRRYIVISSGICDDKYEMVFAKNAESLDEEFRLLMLTYILTASGVSLILAVCLYFVLKKLSSPLEKLRKTTEIVRAGDFSVTAEETGNDEFTLLAKSFNAMLARINGQMVALEHEAERKQMLVDNMAHELRTPLTSIHGYAEYLENANTTPERRRIAAKYILSESGRLQKISEILLDSALVRENGMERTEVELGGVLADVAGKLQMRAEKSAVRLFCETSPVTVMGNETLLSMLFYNLTENAIKACEAGGQVKMSCSAGQAIIEDNGKGMTEEQLLHIAEPFYRTDKSRSRAEGGAGLGLALCQQIVRAHGAVMRFESKIGRGTKIVVTFTDWQQSGDNPAGFF